jgi:hypothetical protein
MGNYQEAIGHLLQADSMYKEAQDARRLILNKIDMCEVYAESHDYTSANNCLSEIKTMAKRMKKRDISERITAIQSLITSRKP